MPGARNKEEFFAGLRNGCGRVAGDSGTFARLTRDVLIISKALMREKAWTMLLAPLAVAIPAITALNYWEEKAFDRKWSARVLSELEKTMYGGKSTIPSHFIHTGRLAFEERAVASGG